MKAVRILLLAAVLGGCVPHPVGRAGTSAKYEGKAVTTARSGLSAVQTVRLASSAAGKGNLLGPYAAVLMNEQEDALSGVQGTFDSIQPPNDESDALRAEFDAILSSALDHVSAVRIATRRGELGRLPAVAAPLADDARALSGFIAGHS